MNEDLYDRSLKSLQEKRDSTSDNSIQLHFNAMIRQLVMEQAHGFSFERLRFKR